MEDAHHNTDPDKRDLARATGALPFIALFVVATVSFLLHFNLLYAPMQGEEFRLLLHDELLHRPDTAIAAHDSMPGAPFAALAVGTLWLLSGGSIMLFRCAALLACVFSVMLLFQTLRLWLGRSESVTAPLLGALLFAVSPATVRVAAAVDAWPAALGGLCALACVVLFLKATEAVHQRDDLYLVLACSVLALAIATHHGLILLPVALVALDMLRVAPTGKLRLSPAWTAHLAVFATAATVAAVIHFSGGALSAPGLPAPLYFLSAVAATAAAWLIVMAPATVFRHAVTLVIVVMLPVGGFLSFRHAVDYLDPIARLERETVADAAPLLQERLALQFLDAARRETDPEKANALLQEALAVWRLRDADSPEASSARRVLGKRLLVAGQYADAAELLAPFLESAPFDPAGFDAALALARAAEVQGQLAQVADYYAFARRRDALPLDDAVRYGTALMRLGNITGAAMQFARLEELEEGSEAATHKTQAINAYNAAQAQLNAGRELIQEDPGDVLGYIAMAEGDLLSGNGLRAFYWLALTLRRDETQTRAWELLGAIFSQHDHAEQFVSQWGALKTPGDPSWLRLARQAALFQAWDGARTFAAQFVTEKTPTAEEFVAVFAMEMRRFSVARDWLEKATEARPDRYEPWLALTDIALAAQQAEEARQLLEEAQERNAPEEELEKRKARIQGDAPLPDEAQPFEPVRTYIQ